MLKINDPDLDFYGRLLTIDQAMRSLEGRLRGVEYRISYDDEKTMEAVEKRDGITGEELKQFINMIEGKVFTVEGTIRDLASQKAKLVEEIESARKEIKAIKARNAELENRVTDLKEQKPGSLLSIKIPVDITGIVAAACMLIIGLMLATNNSEILRQPAFSTLIGVAFIIAVAGKRFMTEHREIKL